VITEIAGQPVKESEAVQQAVEQSSIGQNLALTIQRGGQQQTITVRPGSLPPQPDR
jgi:S1-C subfamily serine protease